MNDNLFVAMQHVLPKQALTVFAGWVAHWRGGRITQAIIEWFVGKYQVNMGEAADPDIRNYACFNDFFTRALKPGARPLADAPFVCPVDGAISQFGRIEGGQVFQAKGHSYSTQGFGGWRCGLGGAVSRRRFCHHLLEPQGLPPHPHAQRRALAPHDPCAWRIVFSQPSNRAWCAGFVCPQ
jgi:phosphatidylserine decarboxylase